MFTPEDREDVVNEFNANLDAILENESHPVNTINPREVLEKSIEEGRNAEAFREHLVGVVQNTVLSSIPVGAPVPSFQVRVNLAHIEATGAWVVDTVIAPVSASYVTKFRFKNTQVLSEMTASSVVEFFADSVEVLLVRSLAKMNVDVINGVFEEILDSENSSATYTIDFILECESSARGHIHDVNPAGVTYVVPIDLAFDASDLLIFGDIDEDEEYVERSEADQLLYDLRVSRIKGSRDSIQTAIEAAQTPVKFVASKNKVIRALTGIGSHSPEVMIRRAFNKTVESLSTASTKDMVVYVQGEDFFGAVERVNGALEVYLPAIDRKTFEAHDADLIAYVEGKIA